MGRDSELRVVALAPAEVARRGLDGLTLYASCRKGMVALLRSVSGPKSFTTESYVSALPSSPSFDFGCKNPVFSEQRRRGAWERKSRPVRNVSGVQFHEDSRSDYNRLLSCIQNYRK